MGGSSGPGRAESSAPRGRIDKRQAILRAAFTVFSREGFAQACVKEIAAEAGVAKPTVYNHLDSKDNLFRHALETVAKEITAENLAAVEALTPDSADLRASLEDVGRQIVRGHADARSCALRRLLFAEVARFPELLDTAVGRGGRRLQSALADRLARLLLADRLRPCDPDEAAGQFLALLTGPLETLTQLGTREVLDEEVRTVARSAADTFLRAYESRPEPVADVTPAAAASAG